MKGVYSMLLLVLSYVMGIDVSFGPIDGSISIEETQGKEHISITGNALL